ncbi:MAG: tRNA (adenosine(37)-N6)-threonylcarbamoyltransferase complex ATPase subunit type 1 TsaE [Spongiibacteraceae bacterium]|jgi:tRNA threonylcarbamoyladenosine biosynthesis protein TsaE|nr:tRNA (adenosine(37)-N6)-threonylcarbamoyltransferase complex ATPase subunit type 1 TsaE [Spongiibacteraceae bacterium]
MTSHCWALADEAATVAFGERLAAVLSGGAVICLEGELGAGKTTLCRGIVQGFGHEGAVKSPTYTLVEPYETPVGSVYHFDLYRLADPEELEFMGIRDYFEGQNVCLIEWPSRGTGFLPAADLTLEIQTVESGRKIVATARSERGCAIVAQLLAMEQPKE